jgi:hypothetical protein
MYWSNPIDSGYVTHTITFQSNFVDNPQEVEKFYRLACYALIDKFTLKDIHEIYEYLIDNWLFHHNSHIEFEKKANYKPSKIEIHRLKDTRAITNH